MLDNERTRPTTTQSCLFVTVRDFPIKKNSTGTVVKPADVLLILSFKYQTNLHRTDKVKFPCGVYAGFNHERAGPDPRTLSEVRLLGMDHVVAKANSPV